MNAVDETEKARALYDFLSVTESHLKIMQRHWKHGQPPPSAIDDAMNFALRTLYPQTVLVHSLALLINDVETCDRILAITREKNKARDRLAMLRNAGRTLDDREHLEFPQCQQ
jgi:hypothetical protein